MNLSVRETGTWQHTLEIEVPTEEVERRLVETALGIQRRVSLPGFRKGRVPLDMVRQQFADAVEQEFLDTIVPRVTGEALAEARLDPVVPALVRNLRFVPGQPLRFEALVEVRPQVEAKDYRGIPLTRKSRPVTDATVEAMLSRLREDSPLKNGSKASSSSCSGMPGPSSRTRIVTWSAASSALMVARLP